MIQKKFVGFDQPSGTVAMFLLPNDGITAKERKTAPFTTTQVMPLYVGDKGHNICFLRLDFLSSNLSWVLSRLHDTIE